MRKPTKAPECIARLRNIGISGDDAYALRRVAMTLHRWHELECGVEGGGVERDETTGKCTWYSSRTGRRTPHADRETPALKRLDKIMSRYPGFAFYVQGDPRGAALWILSPRNVEWMKAAAGQIDSHYTQGVAVYQ